MSITEDITRQMRAQEVNHKTSWQLDDSDDLCTVPMIPIIEPNLRLYN